MSNATDNLRSFTEVTSPRSMHRKDEVIVDFEKNFLWSNEKSDNKIERRNAEPILFPMLKL